jgi:Flp pilus assembly protein TadG
MKKSFVLTQYGQTLVEFALIIPVFILLAVLIFDFGRAVYYLNALHNAAREGARWGAVRYVDEDSGNRVIDTDGIDKAVHKFAVGLTIQDSDITAIIDPNYYETFGDQTNPAIRVEVTYEYYPVTPLISFILPNGNPYITLTGNAVMRTEWTPKPLPGP